MHRTLTSGFGLGDSISDIIDNQWPAISHYDYCGNDPSMFLEEEVDQINRAQSSGSYKHSSHNKRKCSS